jgi:SAM-dependent methyltransferase
MDPHRRLDANLEIIASYVQPVDTVIDVGGGAGRISLPLALRCPQVINVDPSPGMRAEFEALVAEAGITNARFVQSDWLKAEGIQGDLSITANVTYFVRDIVPFIEKMEAASGRRVMVIVWSVPPPNQRSKLFRLVYGEDQELAPGHRELLPVLWEMGILPDMRVFPGLPLVPGAPLATQFPQTPEEAMQLGDLKASG